MRSIASICFIVRKVSMRAAYSAAPICLAAVSACTNLSTSTRATFPIVEIYVNGDSCPPPPPVHIPRGLLFATCKDGRVLSVSPGEEVGTNLVEGRLSSRSLNRFQGLLTATQIDALSIECQTHLTDGGTANIEVWRGNSRETFQCDWPPREGVGDLIHQAVVQAEILGAIPSAHSVDSLCE